MDNKVMTPNTSMPFQIFMMACKHTSSDHSFGYIPDVALHPPAVVPPQHIQNGALVLWLQDHPKSGSADLIVGWQQGYIRDGTSASNFVERASVGQNGRLRDYAPTEAYFDLYRTCLKLSRYVQHHSTALQHAHHSVPMIAITYGIQDQDNVQYPTLHDIQPPSYTNSTRSGDIDYNVYGQSWIPYDQLMVQDLEVLQTQVSGRQSTPLLISELVNSATGSVEQDTMTDEADLSKDCMIKEIETFFTESFEQLSVELHGTKQNEKLPWLQFDNTLEDEGIEMMNWPEDVLTPGKGSNSSKGLAGPGQAVSQQEFFAESSASGSRKRPRDAGSTDGDGGPRKQKLVFKNIWYDGVMEAWKPDQAVSQQEFFTKSLASGSRKRPRDTENTDGDSRLKKQLVFKNIRECVAKINDVHFRMASEEDAKIVHHRTHFLAVAVSPPISLTPLSTMLVSCMYGGFKRWPGWPVTAGVDWALLVNGICLRMFETHQY
ncbi:hypothetical protein C8J56DRAFT_890844 [Mycena floridula]|nr:hypothetical protein C8J56DRAFT_890844 [Mycena floridula]